MFDPVSAVLGLGWGLSAGLIVVAVAFKGRLRSAEVNQASLLDRLSSRGLAEYHAAQDIGSYNLPTEELKQQYRTLTDPIAGLIHMQIPVDESPVSSDEEDLFS